MTVEAKAIRWFIKKCRWYNRRNTWPTKEEKKILLNCAIDAYKAGHRAGVKIGKRK